MSPCQRELPPLPESHTPTSHSSPRCPVSVSSASEKLTLTFSCLCVYSLSPPLECVPHGGRALVCMETRHYNPRARPTAGWEGDRVASPRSESLRQPGPSPERQSAQPFKGNIWHGVGRGRCSIPVRQMNEQTQEHSSESLRLQTAGPALPCSGLCPELLQIHDVSIFLKPKTQGHSQTSSLLELLSHL